MVPSQLRAETLMEVYHQALERDYQLAIAQATRASAQDASRLLQAQALPQLSLNQAIDREQGGGSRSAGTITALTLNQVVFDARLRAQVRSAKSRATSQEATFRAAQQTLALRVATAYLDAVLAADQVSTQEANAAAYAFQLDQARVRFATGNAAKVDVDQAEAAFSSAQGSLIEAQQALVDARLGIGELTGTEPASLQSLSDFVLERPVPADPQLWIAAALAHSPTLDASMHDLEAASHAIEAARAEELPVVSASLGVQRLTQSLSPASRGRDSASLGITISLPLYNGGAFDAIKAAALHSKDAAIAAAEGQRRSVTRAVLSAYQLTNSAISRVIATRDSIAAARRSLAETRAAQEIGNRTTTDVLNAIQALTSAQDAYGVARRQSVLAWLSLLQAAGRLGESDLTQVEAFLE
jgi:outer membrane protein